MTNKRQNTTSDWQSRDQRHYLHPFTDHKELGKKGSRIITRAEGIYVWDSDRNKILDGMSGLWCVNLGMDLMEVAPAYDVGEITALAGATLAAEFLCLYAANPSR